MMQPVWEVAVGDNHRAETIQHNLGVTRPTALALAGLPMALEDLDDFLRPTLRHLADPYHLDGTRVAAERLWDAIRRQEHILIHGDYDTDGITAATLLAGVLKENNAQAECFLPHRIDDGYRLTPESIEKACREHHSLLVTVDCGITSCEAVAAAREAGIDVIVTDHHQPGAERPDAHAVVDPKLEGTDPELQDLAGVGVAFKICHAFLKYGREQNIGGFETDLREFLDLVALGTVADIVPLLRENRRLVKHGLRVLSRQHRPGIRALCEIVRIDDAVRAPDIAFRIAPRLNAAGRMGDPADTMDLLCATSMAHAKPLAAALDRQNRRRQSLEEDTLRAATAQIEAVYDLKRDRTLVVWGEEWHPGVVGIVASRLARSYHRPAVVLTRENTGDFCGSSRSVRPIDLTRALELCSDCLTRFGGHPMAAGLSLPPEKLACFRKRFEEAVRDTLGDRAVSPRIEVLGEVAFGEITDRFFEELEVLEPFGHGNPEPVYTLRNVQPDRVLPAGRSHARGVLRDPAGGRMTFIAFGKKPDALPSPPWNIAYTPHINRYRGRETPQARIVEVETT